MRTLARFVTKYYKTIMVAWIALFIAMAIFALRLPGLLAGDGFRMDAEHEQVMKIASETFDLPAETMFVVFDNVDDETIASTLVDIEELDLTSEVVSPLDHEEQYTKNVSYALLHFEETDKDMSGVVTDIRDAIGDEKGIVLTGQSAITKDINSASQRDLMKAEAIGLPIAIIVLLFAFGSVMASMVPLMVGIATVITTFGVLAIVGGQTDLSIFVLNIVPMLGLALSIDFSLLFISRYREERLKRDILESVATTIRTAGRSIIFSAFCVFIGLGAMFIIKVEIFQNIALGGMIVVGMAVLSSVTLLPAILIMLGDRLNKGRVLKVKENGSDRWRQFANAVIKRPILITIVALILLGIAIIPVKNMDLTIPQIDSLPASYDTRSSYELMDDTFGLGDQSNVYMIAERDGGWSDTEGLQAMKALEDDLSDDPLVDGLTTIYTASGVGTPEEWEQVMQMPEMKAQLEPLLDVIREG